MRELTSFVRSRTAALIDRIRWQLVVLRTGLSLKPIRGADGEPGGAGGEGGGEGGEPGAGGEGGSPAGGGEGGEPELKYTEEDLTRAVERRLIRDRKDRPSDEQIEEWKSKAEKQDEAEAANQTELERERNAREEAEKTAQAATTRANDALRKAAIMAAATAEKAVQPEAVHALLKERGFKFGEDSNQLEVTVGDDGQVTNAYEIVKAFLAADENKYLVGTTPSPGPGDGGAREPVPTKDLDEQIAEAEEKGDWATFNRLNAMKLGQTKEGAPS